MGLSQSCLPHQLCKFIIRYCRIGPGALYPPVRLSQIPVFKRRPDLGLWAWRRARLCGRVSSDPMINPGVILQFCTFALLFRSLLYVETVFTARTNVFIACRRAFLSLLGELGCDLRVLHGI